MRYFMYLHSQLTRDGKGQTYCTFYKGILEDIGFY